MKLSEAIRAGSKSTSQCRGGLIRKRLGEEYETCALGAALVGNMPPELAWRNTDKSGTLQRSFPQLMSPPPVGCLAPGADLWGTIVAWNDYDGLPREETALRLEQVGL